PTFMSGLFVAYARSVIAVTLLRTPRGKISAGPTCTFTDSSSWLPHANARNKNAGHPSRRIAGDLSISSSTFCGCAEAGRARVLRDAGADAGALQSMHHRSGGSPSARDGGPPHAPNHERSRHTPCPARQEIGVGGRVAS